MRVGAVDPREHYTAGPTIDLDPMVVTPMITSLERLMQDLERDPRQFLTDEAWLGEMGYRSIIDEALNLFSIPLFGMPQEFIAMQYARDAMLEQRLERFERIIEARSRISKGVAEAYLQERYDLMRMKQHALFGSHWAIPEIGK
jgi:hypothetical protein